jgi:hypothetical protein
VDGSRKCSAYGDLRYRHAFPEAQLVSSIIRSRADFAIKLRLKGDANSQCAEESMLGKERAKTIAKLSRRVLVSLCC